LAQLWAADGPIDQHTGHEVSRLNGSEMDPMKQSQVIRISQETYADMSENYGGYCTHCGDEASGVEPDARQYVCESCGERTVYGIEELLISGLIQFTDVED
jgi:hypothetical protein